MDFGSFIPTSLHPELSGFTGGLQLGHNWQLGKLVLGLEADISGFAADGSDAVRDGFAGNLETRLTCELDWLSTLRGRVGFLPTQDLLVFATGGVAFAKVEQHLTFSNLTSDSTFGARNGGSTLVCPPDVCLAGSSSETSAGWTAGGSFEYAITPQISLKVKYLFVDLSSHSVTARSSDPGTTPDVFLKATSDVELHIVRAGMNVKFGDRRRRGRSGFARIRHQPAPALIPGASRRPGPGCSVGLQPRTDAQDDVPVVARQEIVDETQELVGRHSKNRGQQRQILLEHGSGTLSTGNRWAKSEGVAQKSGQKSRCNKRSDCSDARPRLRPARIGASRADARCTLPFAGSATTLAESKQAGLFTFFRAQLRGELLEGSDRPCVSVLKS
jgi:outer membrane immunogenic protein